MPGARVITCAPRHGAVPTLRTVNANRREPSVPITGGASSTLSARSQNENTARRRTTLSPSAASPAADSVSSSVASFGSAAP